MNHKKIDLLDLNQAGGIKENCESIISWNDGSSARILITTNDKVTRASITYKDFDSEILEASDNLLVKTPCNFGKYRWYFRCNSKDCNKKVRILYKAENTFSCRECVDIKYKSCEYNYSLKNPDFRSFYYAFKAYRYLIENKGNLYYNDKPTRKLKTYIKLYNKSNKGIPP